MSSARASLILLVLLAASPAHADEAIHRANTISLDPLLGVLGFTGRNVGEWTVNYERRLAPHHTLLVEHSTVHVHQPPWHLTTLSLGAGYRYYLRASGTGPFVGAVAGAKLGTGRFGHGGHGAHMPGAEPDVKLTARAAFATAHVGWRRTWTNGFTLAARLGAGWATYAINDAAPMEADAMKDARLAPLPFELDSELSLGYSF